MLKNHVFGSFNLNNSEKHRLSFEDIFCGTLDTYTKKMNPPSAVLGGCTVRSAGSKPIRECLKSIKLGKAADLDGLATEHFVYIHTILFMSTCRYYLLA